MFFKTIVQYLTKYTTLTKKIQPILYTFFEMIVQYCIEYTTLSKSIYSVCHITPCPTITRLQHYSMYHITPWVILHLAIYHSEYTTLTKNIDAICHITPCDILPYVQYYPMSFYRIFATVLKTYAQIYDPPYLSKKDCTIL